ncbi:FecCD family ABC transporter permease [Paraoerskovia marina]|uniref:FecCD family ABC transporter permease n=1 Tax=Paraoerskovia marina TaxID=545619 RepID=UPI003D159BE9
MRPSTGLVTRRGPSRGTVTAVVLGLLLALLALVAMGLGDYPLGPVEVLRALVSDQGFDTVVVTEWRLPRVLAALVFGAALGVSGALFQSLTRNPLGSPDVIGFSTGSFTGVLVFTIIFGGSTLGTTGGAIVGGLATALVVYLLAYRRGIQGFRLIVVGIAVTAMLHSFNVWLLLQVQTEVAMSASIWAAGTLSLVGWERLLPAAVMLAVLVPVVLGVAGPLRQLELGDDAAAAHGVRVEPARLVILVVGVSLTAIVTATTGPIAFVALAAPQVARRIARSAGLPLGHAALVGAMLLLAADVVAQHLLPTALPVGVVTVVLGGIYLLNLLVREARRAA